MVKVYEGCLLNYRDVKEGTSEKGPWKLAVCSESDIGKGSKVSLFINNIDTCGVEVGTKGQLMVDKINFVQYNKKKDNEGKWTIQNTSCNVDVHAVGEAALSNGGTGSFESSSSAFDAELPF